MTFGDLKKKIVNFQSLSHQTKLAEMLLSKPFWIWDVNKHKQEDMKSRGSCCFNHIVGSPMKNKIEKPLFDYEKRLFDALLIPDSDNPLKNNFKHRHVWVKKATGLGITEFVLRLMAWLCLKDDAFRNCQMCIVTGPNVEISIKLIRRLKAIFEPKLGITFQSKETVVGLNGCTIEAYPSNHLDSFRALDNPSLFSLTKLTFSEKQNKKT